MIVLCNCAEDFAGTLIHFWLFLVVTKSYQNINRICKTLVPIKKYFVYSLYCTRLICFLFILAPELLNFDPVLPGSDMWSVAVITYILLVSCLYI